ncbi:hypothetical protein GCM10023166_09790 [Paeniglutamicibacter cryotolerans]|uniref:Uncharacterized protein n=1 Tax=Paeniglutamicibacter cryotolerans TaxID=670079 RepID=A0A839QRD3_9MICC|nr:hypothetical protein [Paeniglutamicibacter cryotolerans]
MAEARSSAYQDLCPGSPFNGQDITIRTLYGCQELCSSCVRGLCDAAGFDGADEWRFDWERSCTREQEPDLMPTGGGLTRLAPDKLAG